MAFAKWDGEPVTVIMADGTRMEGFTKTNLINHMRGPKSEIGISEEFKGKEKKYTSTEISELIFPPNENASTPAIYRPVLAQKYMPNAFSKNPKTFKKPVFLKCVYDGENVKGYARACTDSSYTPSMTRVNYTWAYYYKVEGEDVAKYYWLDTKDLIFGMRKVLKFYFREFPELVQMIEDGTLDPNDFRDDPTIVLPMMDAILGQRK
ncbi:MAG: hypothetical protein K2K49_05440 [Duncaniella sp.]|nr:hypothetical protein [Duncaniella sp.]